MNKKGFTLIEMLFVIAIVGLLSSIAVYSLTTVKGRARDAKRSADLSQLGKALDLYINQTGSPYPTTTTPTCLDGSDLVNTALIGANLLGNPITDPLDLNGATCFLYVTDAEGVNYSIQYYLETGSVGDPGLHIYP